MERSEEYQDYEAASIDPDDFAEPLEGPEYVDPADMPDPPNDLEGPDAEPPHLERGSPHVDDPGPNPYDEPNPNVP